MKINYSISSSCAINDLRDFYNANEPKTDICKTI